MLIYKKANLDYFDDFYKLKCDPLNVEWTGHLSAPDRDGLRLWYKEAIKSRSRSIFLFYLDEDVVGYLYIDSSPNGVYEISYSVMSPFWGRGYGKQIVSFSEAYVSENSDRDGYLQAWISDLNVASIRCVLANGFLLSDANISKPLLGGLTEFRCYKKAFSSRN